VINGWQGRCPLFRPLLTILYARQRSTSGYSTVSFGQVDGRHGSLLMDVCRGSDDSSCMLCCIPLRTRCIRQIAACKVGLEHG
jgi:hypothetical protein